MPRVVRIMAFLMVSQVLCGFWILGMEVSGLLSGGLMGDPIARIAVAEMIWHVLAAVVLIRPFLLRSATAWAAVEGMVLCAVVVSAGTAILSLTRAQIMLAPGYYLMMDGASALVGLLLETVLGVALFRARGWFGVGAREGWRTLWKRGWWALVVTGGLGAAYLLAIATRPA